MKFTVERRALIKMLEVIGRKAPSKKWRDKEVRLAVCDARVFVEANESAGGVEALVFEDGTCMLDHKMFLQLLKMHPKKKVLIVEVNERKITFATTSLPVTQFSKTVISPGKFKVFPVTDGWVSQSRAETESKLPNADKAIVEQEKILGYLLNPKHPLGAAKANFFSRYGFTPDKWKILAEALRLHGQTNNVNQIRDTNYGPQYIVEGRIDAPDGRAPFVRSVWQMDKGAVAPRLITAYPLEAG
jgi:uncharacterized protein DUF6883